MSSTRLKIIWKTVWSTLKVSSECIKILICLFFQSFTFQLFWHFVRKRTCLTWSRCTGATKPCQIQTNSPPPNNQVCELYDFMFYVIWRWLQMLVKCSIKEELSTLSEPIKTKSCILLFDSLCIFVNNGVCTRYEKRQGVLLLYLKKKRSTTVRNLTGEKVIKSTHAKRTHLTTVFWNKRYNINNKWE